ncbi:MAG: EamA family transporter [Candidatus Micrarchaeia archaeon]
MNVFLIVLLTLFAALIASLAQLAFKKALKPDISFIEIIKLIKNKYVITGGAGYVLSLAIYLYALYNAPLSIVYPIFASTFIFIVILSRLVLNEKISNLRYLGIGIIFIGIVIISMTF